MAPRLLKVPSRLKLHLEPSAPLLRIEDAAPMSWEELRPLVEDKLGLQTGSTWPTFPLLDNVLDLVSNAFVLW